MNERVVTAQPSLFRDPHLEQLHATLNAPECTQEQALEALLCVAAAQRGPAGDFGLMVSAPAIAKAVAAILPETPWRLTR